MKTRWRPFLRRGRTHVNIQHSEISGWMKDLQIIPLSAGSCVYGTGAGGEAKEVQRRNGNVVSSVLLRGGFPAVWGVQWHDQICSLDSLFWPRGWDHFKAMLEEMRQVGRLAQSSRWRAMQAWTEKMAKWIRKAVDLRCSEQINKIW